MSAKKTMPNIEELFCFRRQQTLRCRAALFLSFNLFVFAVICNKAIACPLVSVGSESMDGVRIGEARAKEEN